MRQTSLRKQIMNFNTKEALVLNHIQGTVPMVRRPFAAIGRDIGLSEDEVVGIITALKERRVIRNFSAIFNPKTLGYAMGLVGMEIPEERIDGAAAIINAHPGVSHNYLRNHRYNIWFTLAEESAEWFSRSVEALAKATGALDFLVLENEQVFKIGVQLPVGGKKPSHGPLSGPASLGHPVPEDLNPEEKEAVTLLQQDLPVVKQPFLSLAMAGNPAMGEKRLLELGASLKERGIMRRYAAVLRHMNAGFTHNAMTVWKLPQPEYTAHSPEIAAFIEERAVSHLYTRTVHPGKWEYPLFAMIHTTSDADMTGVVERLSRKSGIKEYMALKSLREFKKQRVVYFSPEFKVWHEKMCPVRPELKTREA